jgi:hypothetical protein
VTGDRPRDGGVHPYLPSEPRPLLLADSSFGWSGPGGGGGCIGERAGSSGHGGDPCSAPSQTYKGRSLLRTTSSIGVVSFLLFFVI